MAFYFILINFSSKILWSVTQEKFQNDSGNLEQNYGTVSTQHMHVDNKSPFLLTLYSQQQKNKNNKNKTLNFITATTAPLSLVDSLLL